MKIPYLILVSISLFSSCSNKKYNFREMEIMSYRYYYFLTEDSINELGTRCYFYSTIDKDGEARIIRNPDKKMNYLAGAIEKPILDHILSSVDTIKGNIHLALINAPWIYMYDGPEVKVKITYSNKSNKTINYHLWYSNSELGPFIDLYNILDKGNLDTCGRNLIDERKLLQKMDSFKRYSLNIDTTIFKIPLPPQIYTGPIKFVFPEETK